MKRILSLLLALALTALCGVTAFAAPLQFDAQGKYKILLIADPQDDETPEPDMAPLIEAAIRKTNPDLIVVLGDLVEDHDVNSETDENGNVRDLSYDETLENCRTALDYVFAPIIASGIPYTAVLGNNDYQAGVNADDWYALLRQQKGILLPETKAYADGRTDSVLPVFGTDGDEALRLLLLDTGTKGVTRDQVKAFGSLNGDRSVPAIVFQHIPVSEAGYLWQFCFPWEEGAIYRGKFFTLRLNTRIASGDDHGKLWDGDVSRQFLGWKACGNVIGAYFGHTHNISVEGTYMGVRMGMVYGDRWNGEYQHGCALLTFDERNVRGYTWTAYRYTGSVTTGDASLCEETYTPYETYTGFAWIIHQWQGLISFLQAKITEIFHS